MKKALLAAAGAAVLLVPAAPASASTADNCFIHTDDWVRCACIPVAQLLTKVTGDQWQCA